MTDDLTSKAYDDLDQIANDASRALDALARDDVETAQDILQDIETTADAWEA